ncbi:Utp14 protein-domain-containing protein [Phyllosticta citrichinensis]|uniref:Utp14 protein-domain-containing protein n=1 Tax=Phyllosticta citrichinensis TaxID=1130410 RepID=A0ABR1XV97_9PEZI
MPRRISRSTVSAGKPKNARKKAQKRNLDAYAIAEREVNDNPKVRKSRLGELEDDDSRRKRQRADSDEDDDEDEGPRQKKQSRGGADDLDVSEGSDSEGNTWHTGRVDDDDDSDIDSDEAFGESDEERFADFTFRGSSTSKSKKKKKALRTEDEDGDIDLGEGDDQSEEDSDDESLGSDAVDLAQMLDDYEEEEDQEKSKGKKSRQQDSQSESEDSEPAGDDEASDYDMSDVDEDDNDPNKISELQNFISSISQDADGKNKKDRPTNAHESAAPSEFGVGSSQKLDIGDLLAGTNDPNAKKMVKMLKDKKSSKRNGIPGKLDAPLPKRLQDKIDRQAANEKAKEQLDRWVDTVKQNRRAEHISFPIKDPDAQEPAGVKHLVPLNNAKPTNALESTIQAIMEESGLATGKNEEEQIREFEELQTNKMPLEEVVARRAELRKARDLLFREEMRAKRVKKIKSKSFRRVHRKERERLEEQERDAMAAAGIEMSEDEQERQDRRRAEERMGAKHRESKWAKGIKATGRATWDEDAREGVNEMARKNEELRRRIEGKDVQGEEEMTDMSSEEDDDDSESGDVRRLQRQLNRVSGPDSAEAGGLSKLASMKFMLRADAALKAQNDEDVKRIRRELAEADGHGVSDEEDNEAAQQSIGRRIFGPSSEKQTKPTKKQPRNEFEEQPGSDDEEEPDPIKTDSQDRDQPREHQSRKQRNVAEQRSRKTGGTVVREPSEDPEDNALAAALSKRPNSKSKSRHGASVDAGPVLDLAENKPRTAKPAKAKATESSAPAESDGWTVVTYDNKETSDDEESDKEPANPFTLKKESLVEKAFAGDEVADVFEAEKRTIEQDEGDKVIDNTLPGWGSWAGSGLSKRARERNSGRFLTTQKGVKKEDRKDAKLKNVVINEKRVKKNSKYLASALPFPHESKQVYESTLRRPLGPEFNTKEIFQDGTKPRVMVKPGVVIKPLAKPLV